ncbi:MAG: hypothetical protein R3C44_18610 [Chloroflexota bacterium]
MNEILIVRRLVKRMEHELEVTGERNELDHEITRKTVNQRTLEAFLEYVSQQLLAGSQPMDAERLKIVPPARTLETLDSLSDDPSRRDRALSFVQELELLKPKDERKKASDLDPLFLPGQFGRLEVSSSPIRKSAR